MTLDISAKTRRILYVLLCERYSYTLIPELHEILGEDKLFEFIKLFSGTTLEIPDINEVRNLLVDVVIYKQMEQATEGTIDSVEANLRDRYKLSKDSLRKAHMRTKKALIRSGLVQEIVEASHGED